MKSQEKILLLHFIKLDIFQRLIKVDHKDTQYLNYQENSLHFMVLGQTQLQMQQT